MNVVVIGKPKYNIYLPTDEYPKETSKYKINEVLEMPGGTSVYVACMLAKWGLKVYFSGAVAGDDIGAKIKKELESNGVDTKYLEMDYEQKSNINYVLINKSNGSSTEIEHINEVYTQKYKFDFVPDFIITDGTDMGASMAAANNYPTSKIITLANKLLAEYEALSKRSTYVCANLRFASALVKIPVDTRPKGMVNLFQKIKDLQKAEYIIMLGDKGVLYTKERQVKMIPAISIEKKDDTNSGSAFFAAYAYGIINGYDMDEVAKIANLAGAQALTKIGTLTSIPEKEALYKMAGINEGEKPAQQAKPQAQVPPKAAQPQQQPEQPQQPAQTPIQQPANQQATQPQQQPAAPNPAPNPNQAVIDNALSGIANNQTAQGTTNENIQ